MVREDHELVDIYGMGLPAVVDDPIAEYEAVREGVGLLDFSPLMKVDVEGADVRAKLNRLHTRDITKLKPGRIAYGAILDEDGLMIDDSTVMVRAEDRVRVVGSPTMPSAGDRVRRGERAEGGRAPRRARPPQHPGPAQPGGTGEADRRGRLERGVPLLHLQRDSITVAGVDDVFVTRMGFTAELGYELFVPVERALEIYDALIEAGGPAGLRPVGVAAIMMVRVEAGMIMGDGLEYDRSVSPWECGLGWAVDLDKGDFRGRDAVLRLRDARTPGLPRSCWSAERTRRAAHRCPPTARP